MRNLIIDIGNTRIKAAFFIDEKLQVEKQYESLELLNAAIRPFDFDHAIISSVRWDKGILQKQLSFDFILLERQTPLPVINGYSSPDTLGLDRIASVIGAAGFAQGEAVLAIDMGTCITCDLLEGGVYRGGSISPGMQMRFRAMHDQTARLPLTDISSGAPYPALPGDNTISCLQSGVYYGIKFELEGMARYYKSLYSDLKVFLCGGDANFFESLTKDYIFVIPNLVLHGLNRILIYNVDKN